jgi:polar amino acid transport system substrate-binding protein
VITCGCEIRNTLDFEHRINAILRRLVQLGRGRITGDNRDGTEFRTPPRRGRRASEPVPDARLCRRHGVARAPVPAGLHPITIRMLALSRSLRLASAAALLCLTASTSGQAEAPDADLRAGPSLPTDKPVSGQVRKQVSKQVTWAVYDAAPYMITDGPEAGMGISDQVRQILTERLDDYTHSVLIVPFPRIVSFLKQGAEWCFVGGVRTEERDAFAYFSRPTGMFYPLRILVRADRRARFEALAPLSLRSLVEEHPDLRTSVLRSRALAPRVDAILRRSPVPQAHSEFGEAFRMLQNDRLDYLVEFANIAAYYEKSFGPSASWVGLPMTEDPEPVLSRVMCSRTPWGRAIIDRIDAILPEERVTDRYRRIVEAWSAEEDLGKLRAVYESSFLSSE